MVHVRGVIYTYIRHIIGEIYIRNRHVGWVIKLIGSKYRMVRVIYY
jgi:hypothetical protein